jgi:hypothetical protein
VHPWREETTCPPRPQAATRGGKFRDVRAVMLKYEFFNRTAAGHVVIQAVSLGNVAFE